MIKVTLPLSEPIPTNPQALEDFWRFVVERQTIYDRRVVKGDPPPWTSDRILREYFFTNVFRELDKGTKFWTEEIVPNCDGYKDLVWNLLVYRYFNAIPTFKALVIEYYGYDHDWDKKALRYSDAWDHVKVGQFLTRRDLE